ncbi:MAG: hypothetical protein ACRECC_05225, partial [Pseudolabrys sp.]
MTQSILRAFRFKIQTAKRHHPYSLRRRVRRIAIELSFAPLKMRARGTPGAAPRFHEAGPTDLDASQHRGMLKSEITASPPMPGVPRAVFLGLLRDLPDGRPFSHRDRFRPWGYPPHEA